MEISVLALLTLLIVSMTAAIVFGNFRKLFNGLRYRRRTHFTFDFPDNFTSSTIDDAQPAAASVTFIPQAYQLPGTTFTDCNLKFMQAILRSLRMTISVILLTFVSS